MNGMVDVHYGWKRVRLLYCLTKVLGDEIWMQKWPGRYSLWMMEESMEMILKSFVTPTLFSFAAHQNKNVIWSLSSLESCWIWNKMDDFRMIHYICTETGRPIKRPHNGSLMAYKAMFTWWTKTRSLCIVLQGGIVLTPKSTSWTNPSAHLCCWLQTLLAATRGGDKVTEPQVWPISIIYSAIYFLCCNRRTATWAIWTKAIAF